MDPNQLNFETAFERLEEILEQMNAGKTSLETSIALYEEADQLIHYCQQSLQNAERRIEMLQKRRSGEIAVNAEGQPLTTADKLTAAT